MNCLHLFRTNNKLESHKKVSENTDFCGVVMPSEDQSTPSILYSSRKQPLKGRMIPSTKELQESDEEFEGEFNCLGENTEKYKTFSVTITKEVKRSNRNGKEITITMSYKLQFIDNARSMASSLSNLVDNLAEVIRKIKCKHGHNNKKCETCGIKCKDCVWCLEYTNVKDNLMLWGHSIITFA